MAKTLIGTRIAAVYELQAEWMEPKLRELGISWSTFQLLTAVANAGDRASQIEVARRLGVTAATLSESVQAHLDKGLLSRTTLPRDKRVKLLRLTPESKAIVERIKELVVQADEAMTRGVLPDEMTLVARVLDRAMENMESALDRE
ncbi:MAG: MarR family transcriptional regulator [Fimbriimonadaceae bacterium]